MRRALEREKTSKFLLHPRSTLLYFIPASFSTAPHFGYEALHSSLQRQYVTI